MNDTIVQGFMFRTVEDDPDNDSICRIVRRAEASDQEVIEMGPAFLVRFGDGHQRVAYAMELSPWYPT